MFTHVLKMELLSLPPSSWLPLGLSVGNVGWYPNIKPTFCICIFSVWFLSSWPHSLVWFYLSDRLHSAQASLAHIPKLNCPLTVYLGKTLACTVLVLVPHCVHVTGALLLCICQSALTLPPGNNTCLAQYFSYLGAKFPNLEFLVLLPFFLSTEVSFTIFFFAFHI